MIDFLKDVGGSDFDKWKSIVKDEYTSKFIKKSQIEQQSEICVNNTKKHMDDKGGKFDCRYCRLEWLKNNDKLQNNNELIKYKYVCVKNNSVIPALNIKDKYVCKFSDWNNGKQYLANVYKYNEKTKPEYVCLHPKLLDLSTDYIKIALKTIKQLCSK